MKPNEVAAIAFGVAAFLFSACSIVISILSYRQSRFTFNQTQQDRKASIKIGLTQMIMLPDDIDLLAVSIANSGRSPIEISHVFVGTEAGQMAFPMEEAYVGECKFPQDLAPGKRIIFQIKLASLIQSLSEKEPIESMTIYIQVFTSLGEKFESDRMNFAEYLKKLEAKNSGRPNEGQ